MKKYISFFLFATIAILTFTGCDDETATIGSSIVPDKDIVTASKKIFYAKSKSIDAGNSIINKSDYMYLGRYTEPQHNTTFEASFLTQFASGDNEAFPKEGVIDNSAVYTKLRIFYDSITGDKNNAMKCEVYELDKVVAEGVSYYTDIDFGEYYDRSKAPIATKVYSAKDYALHDSLTEANYDANIEIALPNEIGTRIIQQYYANPADFENSEVFINNVFKGIYVKNSQGDGTLINVYRTRLEIAFSHYIKSSSGEKDSIETLFTPFYSNKEVLQLNKFDNGDLTPYMSNTDATYIKTPAGIFTEVELPINEIMEECAGDTLNSVKIEFAGFRADENNDFNPPTTLLMVRKKDMTEFFEKNKVCDNITSFYATITSNSNRYTFGNIAKLIKYCYSEYEAGEADADWEKVVLIPINAITDGYGNLVKVKHYTQLSNMRLQGGDNRPIEVEVVSSRYK